MSARGSSRTAGTASVPTAKRGERRPDHDREPRSGEFYVRLGLRGVDASDLAFLGQMAWISALGRAHDGGKSEGRRRR